MTKIEALEKSLKTWEWLAQTGANKLDYFDVLGEIIPWNYCYLCELCVERNKNLRIVHCEKCPVIWGEEKQEREEGIYCQDTSSPYQAWRKAESIEMKQKYARKVADLIRTTLEQDKKK